MISRQVMCMEVFQKTLWKWSVLEWGFCPVSWFGLQAQKPQLSRIFSSLEENDRNLNFIKIVLGQREICFKVLQAQSMKACPLHGVNLNRSSYLKPFQTLYPELRTCYTQTWWYLMYTLIFTVRVDLLQVSLLPSQDAEKKLHLNTCSEKTERLIASPQFELQVSSGQ